MIATIVKRGNIDIDSSNAQFLDLCSDVLWSTLNHSEGTVCNQKMRDFIVNELEK